MTREEERRKRQREYQFLYRQRPEEKARRKEHRSQPSIRQAAREYQARPEVKARARQTLLERKFLRGLEMTREEYEGWKAWTETGKFRWQVDPIHNGQNGKDLLAYIGGINHGKYISIDPDGMLMLGSYRDADPHIGEATFKILAKKKYGSFREAMEHVIQSGGLTFLKDHLPKLECLCGGAVRHYHQGKGCCGGSMCCPAANE